MSNTYIEKKEDIENFLSDLHTVLTNPKFDYNNPNNLDILRNKKGDIPSDIHTTRNTLIDLDYDKEDIYKELLALDINTYYNTVIDDKNSNLPPFRAFGKDIKEKQVYIKIKIRDKEKLKTFCVSFRYAKRPFKADDFPYK